MEGKGKRDLFIFCTVHRLSLPSPILVFRKKENNNKIKSDEGKWILLDITGCFTAQGPCTTRAVHSSLCTKKSILLLQENFCFALW